MGGVTTIQLDQSVVKALKEIKDFPRQTYNEQVVRLIAVFKSVKKRNQYYEFLHKIQQPKMKELWDNEKDGTRVKSR